MPENHGRAVCAERLYEQDKGEDKENGEQEIAARRHPSHHRYEHGMQSEHEREQERKPSLVSQSEQERKHAKTGREGKRKIEEKIEERVGPADESVEHETHR